MGPKTTGDRYGRQIGVKRVTWILGHNATLLARIVVRRFRGVDGLLFENSSDRRLADVDAGSCQLVGDLYFAKRRTE